MKLFLEARIRRQIQDYFHLSVLQKLPRLPDQEKEGSLLDPGTNCRVGQAVLSSNLIMSTVIIL